MTSKALGVSGKDLHLLSARSQNDRAIITANKSKDPLLVLVVQEALKGVMTEILEKPHKQELFNKLLLERTVELISKISDITKQEKLIRQVAKIGETVMRYNVIQTKGIGLEPSISVRSPHFKIYDAGMEIPERVAKFNPNVKHTIPLDLYLEERISGPIQELIKRGTLVDLFVGPIDDMQPYYFHSGKYELKYTLNTRSSTKYFLFEDKKGFQRVVIAGISNESKLTHTLLQLKATGLSLERVSVRGNVEFCAEILQKKLYERFQTAVGEKPIALAVMGNRSEMVLEVAERLYPDKMKGPFKTADEREEAAVALLTKHNNYKEVNVDGIFKFSTVDVEIDGKTQALVSFRMPNGDLARIATRLILDRRQVGGFLMVGAGGSLKKGSPVGSYQMTTTSHLDGKEPVEIDKKRIMPLDFCKRDFCLLNNTNLTVLSPLIETVQWLNDVQEKVHSVDVETYFIMEALSSALKAEACKTMVIPGVFISDEVGGAHPLTEKIDPKNAWVQLSTLLKQSLTHFKVEDKRLKVKEVIEKPVEKIGSEGGMPPPTPRDDSRRIAGGILKTAAVGALMFAGGFFLGKTLSK